MKNYLKSKVLIWGSLSAIALFVVVGGLSFLMMLGGATQTADCYNADTNESDSGHGYGGDWKDPKSKTHKNIQYAIDKFHHNIKMSGDNIAAAIAVGLRESGFNPEAVNSSGQVKGIYQWGFGKVNGNRYGNTKDTVEAQINLAITELRGTHKQTLIDLATADNIKSSMVVWDVNFEGVSVNDPQRKVADTLKTAQEVKKAFNLNYPGDIDVFHDDTGNSDAADAADNNGFDTLDCDTGIVGNTSGLPIKGTYNITGGYPNYEGITGAEHYGVDFQTINPDESSESGFVYAVQDGVVVVKTYNSTGGNYIVIKGTDGVYTYYGHAPEQSSIVVNVGDHVKKGQHISHEGQTGEATGIHVHFAVNTKDSFGWGPHYAGLKSPGQYLELPKKVGTGVVIKGGPFKAKNKDSDK